MPFSSAAKNLMLMALGTPTGSLQSTGSIWASLHTGDPQDFGFNEVSFLSGSPAYARKRIDLDVPFGGARIAHNVDAVPQFDVPFGTTIAYVGYWLYPNTTSSDHFLGSYAVPTASFVTQGTYKLTYELFSISN